MIFFIVEFLNHVLNSFVILRVVCAKSWGLDLIGFWFERVCNLLERRDNISNHLRTLWTQSACLQKPMALGVDFPWIELIHIRRVNKVAYIHQV